MENVVYSDKKQSTSGSDDIFSEEGDIVYTHVLSNTWKLLHPIDDTMPRSDIIGFNSNKTCKK